MIQNRHPILIWLLLLLHIITAADCFAQQNMIINLDMLDGAELTPANIFSFQVINNNGTTKNAVFTGSIRYRGSNLRIGYTFHAAITPGINTFSRDRVSSLTWNYSDAALKDLFINYSKLPEGNYEYCVHLSPDNSGSESQPSILAEGCVYNQSKDIFLINLADPENKAKLYEQYPVLSWAVTSPLAGSLTYRVRVAELKNGQNEVNAIARNPPMYEERNLSGFSVQYPVTAKPLQKWQPYVWTVDAYYRGLLLGGAETWKFMIVDDSAFAAVPRDQSYYEFAAHHGDTRVYAIGQLKLKYISERMGDSLQLRLYNADKQEIKLHTASISVAPGANYLQVDMSEQVTLTHGKNYNLIITDRDKQQFTVPFTYINPLYLK